MKKVYAAVLLLITNVAFGQILYEESFETNTNGTNYNTSIAEFSDGFGDFFLRTDGSDISTSYEVTNIDGSFFFAGMDMDGEGATLPVNLSTTSINVGGLSSVDFSVLLAEDDDGTNEDWDDADYFHITYSIDGGAMQNLIWIENDGIGTGLGSNGAPLIDTDFDGVGDGAEITSVFTEYTQNIPLTGASNIQFFFESSLNAGDEDIAIDNIVVSTTPTGPFISANPTSLTGFQQFVGTPSVEQTFEVAGSNLSDDITLSVTGDYEISETTGAGFGTSITLTQTAGSVAATTIYVRLNGATPASPSNGIVTLSSASATDVEVILEGEILSQDPVLFVTPGSLSGFSHFVGTPSVEQTFEVSGQFLTNDIVVTAPGEYEVSTTAGAGFGQSVTLTQASGTVAATTIYIRLNGTAANSSQNGDVLIESLGATDETVALEGETLEYTLYPIGSVTTVDATSGVADSLDVFVELRGVVHCFDFDDDAGYSFTIIDSQEDGINVFNFNDVDGYVATEGDSIGVKGSIDQFNGLTQIFADEITLFSQGNATLAPTVVTALDESTESQLVTMENLTLVNGETTWPNGNNIDVTDGTNTFTVRVTGGSPLAGTATPSGAFDITGLGGQFDSSNPYDGGYQLFPCSVNELCNVDVSTTVADLTISAVATGLDYQWIDCNDNSNPISGETNQSFTASSNGSYAVIITDGSCVDTSDCVDITTVGLSSSDVVESISLYPNPVSNQMVVNNTEGLISEIKVLNATGQIIYSELLNTNNKKVSTSNWESGVYFVHVTTPKGKVTLRVVK